jgi:C4-dicarboxylate transporter, DctQ subunit
MLRRFFHLLGRIEETILCLMVLQMGLSVFLQVVMRYVFHSAITWLDELVHIEVVLLTFFGASLGIRYGAHICVDVLRNRFKEPFQSILEALNHLVITVYVLLVIIFGSNLIQKMTAHPHFTPTLRIPKHYLYFVVCIGLGLIGARSLAKTCQIVSGLVSNRTGGNAP